jgi:hypothetical protein
MVRCIVLVRYILMLRCVVKVGENDVFTGCDTCDMMCCARHDVL